MSQHESKLVVEKVIKIHGFELKVTFVTSLRI